MSNDFWQTRHWALCWLTSWIIGPQFTVLYIFSTLNNYSNICNKGCQTEYAGVPNWIHRGVYLPSNKSFHLGKLSRLITRGSMWNHHHRSKTQIYDIYLIKCNLYYWLEVYGVPIEIIDIECVLLSRFSQNFVSTKWRIEKGIFTRSRLLQWRISRGSGTFARGARLSSFVWTCLVCIL